MHWSSAFLRSSLGRVPYEWKKQWQISSLPYGESCVAGRKDERKLVGATWVRESLRGAGEGAEGRKKKLFTCSKWNSTTRESGEVCVWSFLENNSSRHFQLPPKSVQRRKAAPTTTVYTTGDNLPEKSSLFFASLRFLCFLAVPGQGGTQSMILAAREIASNWDFVG